jgi:hypothetical protein
MIWLIQLNTLGKRYSYEISQIITANFDTNSFFLKSHFNKQQFAIHLKFSLTFLMREVTQFEKTTFRIGK